MKNEQITDQISRREMLQLVGLGMIGLGIMGNVAQTINKAKTPEQFPYTAFIKLPNGAILAPVQNQALIKELLENNPNLRLASAQTMQQTTNELKIKRITPLFMTAVSGLALFLHGMTSYVLHGAAEQKDDAQIIKKMRSLLRKMRAEYTVPAAVSIEVVRDRVWNDVEGAAKDRIQSLSQRKDIANTVIPVKLTESEWQIYQKISQQ